jgi:hypothetical protein
MQVERQRYVTVGGAEGEPGRDQKVGPLEKFDWGEASDALSKVIGGAYITSWNVDFLQRDLGPEGTCARFYIDRKVVVDVGDPESKTALRKRKLLFRHGFGYVCFPTGYTTSVEKLTPLYQAALNEYKQYEKVHPRPAVLQETVILDERTGQARRALVTAMDVIVGGGIKGNVEQQQRELAAVKSLTKQELRHLKLTSRMHRKLRRAIQDGVPFRNPFIGNGKRLYPIAYQS